VPYHHGSERKKFDACQHRLRQQYEQAGMSEAEIQALYQLDLQEFLSERRHRENTQSFAEECCGAHCDDCTLWISELLSQKDYEILILYAIEGFSQAEIADCLSLSQQNISRRIARLKKYFKNF